MKVTLWHKQPDKPEVKPARKAVSRREKAPVAMAEQHWIMVDGAVYARIVEVAERQKRSVAETLDLAIHKALDAIYLVRGKQ